MKYIFTIFQDTFPMWFPQLHILNAPRFFQILYNMAKPFLHQRTRDTIIFHSDYNSLYEYVDREILPKEYGGDIGPFDNTPSATAVYEMLEYFVQLDKYVKRINEWEWIITL